MDADLPTESSPLSLLSGTDPQGQPSLDALFMGYGMFYSLHPPWIASTDKCSGSRGSLKLRTPAFLSLKGWERWDEGKPGSSSPVLLLHQIRFTSPLTDKTGPHSHTPVLKGRLNHSSSLLTKLGLFLLSVSNVYGCLNGSMTSHTTEFYELYLTTGLFTGPFTFRLHSNSVIIQAVLPRPSQLAIPSADHALSSNTFVCLTRSESQTNPN